MAAAFTFTPIRLLKPADDIMAGAKKAVGGRSTNAIVQNGQRALKDFDISDAYVKPKHLSTTGGNGAKFLGNSKE